MASSEPLGAGRGLLERARLGRRVPWRRPPRAGEMIENHYLATDELAERLGLGDDVRASLYADLRALGRQGRAGGGQGRARSCSPARLVNLADVVEVFHRIGGVEAAIAVARERSGTQFDPDLVDVFCDEAPTLFDELDAATTWDA